GAGHAAQAGGHGRAGRARAGRHRLPHPALEDARADLRVAGAAPERHVRAVREQLVALDAGAVALQVEPLDLVAGLDRHLRVSDLNELEVEVAAVRAERADAVVGAVRVVTL